LPRFNLVWQRAGGLTAPQSPADVAESEINPNPRTDRGVVWPTPPELQVTRRALGADRGYEIHQPPEAPPGGFAAICGRLDNHRELCDRSGVRGARRTPLDDAGLLWVLYRSSGVDAFLGLQGIFTAIVVDFDGQSIHLFRSPLLGESLYYFVSAEWFVAASEAHRVLRHPAAGTDLDDTWLANFFNFHTPSSAATPFRSVAELLPGELLTVTRGSHENVRIPPGIGGRRIRFSGEQEYVERFDELVSCAVAKQVKSRARIGVMLSGGLDSVPAAYWMRRHLDKDGQPSVYSWSLGGFPEADESSLITESADLIGIPVHLAAGDELWPLSRPRDLPLHPDTPQQNPFRLLKQAVYGLAQADGCRFIFNGNFGDNLYPKYHHVLADALYDGKLGRFAREFKFLVELEGLQGLYRHSAVRQIAKKALAWRGRTRIPGNALTPFANGLVDWERNWPPEARDHPRPDQYRALLGLDAARGIAGEDYFARRYGLELVEPYVDWDLADFVLSVPSYVFWNVGETKRLMREAMKGRIPESVRSRPRGGLLDSFYIYGMDKRIDWIKQRLFSGEADWPRFAERSRIKAILERGKPGERGRMLLWQCLTYEMWLDRYFR
jgi:asparagine synthase (glutamine-hydrolysing)